MKHLDVLRNADLVITREEGRQRINSLNPVPLRRIYERWVSKFSDYWATNIVGLKDSLEMPTAGACPITHEQKDFTMSAKSTIESVLVVSEQMLMMAIDGLSANPMVRPTGDGGPHPLWLVGHLAVVEAGVPNILMGKESPLAEWSPLFGRGVEPSDDASIYPSFSEVVAAFKKYRAANMEHFAMLTEADLNKPTANPPAGLEQHFATWGSTYLFVGIHLIAHRGQLADARRVVGLEKAFG